MNKDIIMLFVFLAIAGGIYFYFDAQRREAELQPIKKSVIAAHRPLVLHFYADWCGACKSYEPILRKALIPYGNTIDCQDLNIDIARNAKLLHICGAHAIPTTVIFDRYGNQIIKETGCLSAKEIDEDLRRAVIYKAR